MHTFNSKLLYRGQFILSSEELPPFNGWRQIGLNHGFTVSVHPDLGLTEAFKDETRLVLLGFILDPFYPEMTDQDILNELVAYIKSFDDLISKSDKYSGRWVFIYQDNHRTNIFHDPCGQRQVYYYFNEKRMACGSTISIIDHFFTPEDDRSEALAQFMKSEEFLSRENDWIGDGTVFLHVKHLMTNFYLNLLERKVVRYWPVEPLGKSDLKEGIELGSEIIKGTMIAADKRQKLALAVTSGMDTRLLLAASKDIKDRISFYVGVYGADKRYVDDLNVPDQLFKKLGLPFYPQKLTCNVPDYFKEIYKKNVIMARPHLPKSAFIYQQLLDFQGKLIVNGNACEISREMPFHRPYPFKKLTACNLAAGYLGYPGQFYVIKHLDAWLKEIEPYCKANDVNVYDMLYWEQKMGNWGALYPAEQDIAVDQLTPFNNRLFLRLTLSVNVKYRVFPNYTLYREMIEFLWPEVLQEPVNPRSLKASLRVWGRHLLVKYIDGY